MVLFDLVLAAVAVITGWRAGRWHVRRVRARARTPLHARVRTGEVDDGH